MALRVLVASFALALLAACGGTGSGTGAERSGVTVRHDPAHKAQADLPSGTLILLPLREAVLTAIDVRTGETTNREVPVGPGDALYHLVKTGDRLVLYGGSVTYALDLTLDGEPTSLGESLYFVPSATDGRVWLVTHDPASPATVRDLRAVREVTLDGRVTAQSVGPPPCPGPTVVAAVEAGVLCQDDGLVVWEPATGKVLKRLAGSYPVDVHGDIVAWCGNGCPALHLTNTRTGEEKVIQADASFSFNETYDGAFSPDGSLLAVPVTVDGREPASRGGSDGVALIDVRTRSVELVAGSRSGVYTALAWSPTGDWLFFTDGEGRVMVYQPGMARATSLPATVPNPVLDMVVR